MAEGELPLGVQLVAAPMAEERLLAVAAWMQNLIAFTAAPSSIN
jgi:Asp-tRNA(Asn)/Glu-tRNA(Gln) amidotransferase A subunit family amidase